MNFLKQRKTKVADYRGCAVLIYSSDRTFLDYYRAMFVSLGFTPVTATTPEGAMGVLRLTVVAFVMVDQDAGLFGCRQVMHHARKSQRQATVVVVCRTPDQNFRREAVALGAADYLKHPALPDDLVQALIPHRARAQRPAFSSH